MTQGTIRTLFVEDEPDLREIVQVALGLDRGFEVTTYGSGEEALEAIENGEKSFDLALLDVRLPCMSGIDLHHKLKRIPRLESIKTVLMTASLLPQIKAADPRGEVLGIIQKPFQALRLASELRTMLERAH